MLLTLGQIAHHVLSLVPLTALHLSALAEDLAHRSVREYALRHFSREATYGPVVSELNRKLHTDRQGKEQNP